MIAIIGLSNQVECPMPTNSGIVNVNEKCQNCKNIYSIRRVRNNMVTVECKYNGEEEY